MKRNLYLRTRARVFLRVSLCLGALVATACAGGKLGLHGELRVGIQVDYPPLAFRSEGEIAGVEAEFAEKIGIALNRRVRFVILDRRELIRALEQDQVDVVMAGLSMTTERQQRVRFIEPYLEVGQMAILRRDQVAKLGRVSELERAGRRVGFVGGTTGELYVRRALTSSVPISFSSVEEGKQAVRNGSIGYFVHDAPTAWRLGMDSDERDLLGLFRPLTREYLAWAVQKDDAGLANQLDALVRSWKTQGEIHPIVTKWVPVRVTQ
jgi:ABC-type amino acid transport substrate-binding protein